MVRVRALETFDHLAKEYLDANIKRTENYAIAKSQTITEAPRLVKFVCVCVCVCACVCNMLRLSPLRVQIIRQH